MKSLSDAKELATNRSTTSRGHQAREPHNKAPFCIQELHLPGASPLCYNLKINAKSLLCLTVGDVQRLPQ